MVGLRSKVRSQTHSYEMAEHVCLRKEMGVAVYVCERNGKATEGETLVIIKWQG